MLWAPLPVVLSALCAVAVSTGTAADEQAAWDALRGGGHFALMRHALAPGTGDPFDFEPGDCDTQRNLDARGRAQARAAGAALRERGVRVSRVLSSQWCRCLDTARLLDVAEVELLPLLDSFFLNRDATLEQTAELRRWIAEHDDPHTVVLVTHHGNISALTGVMPSSGGIVVVRAARDGDIVVVGAIPPAP